MREPPADPMDEIEREFGKANSGHPRTLQATWLGRFILDGHAIADEYTMTGSSGDVIVLGVNLRAYDAAKQTWNMKWLNALAGTWVDLGPDETWSEFMVVEARRSND